VLETSARLLRLLSLLQRHAFWRAQELADELGVTTRTVRRDVDRLRDLGYPVDATAGRCGGYQLGNGGALPPLLLDDDEAVAIAVGLRGATTGTVVGVEDTAIAALAKLEQLLPDRLRRRVDALAASTVRFATNDESRIEPALLMTIAQACRNSERLRVSYVDREDHATERRVEPYRLVHTGRRWYLVARDLDRDDWRTFRVDRIRDAVATGHRFTLESTPDPLAMVSKGMSVAPYRFQARVRVDATPEQLRRVVPPSVGVVEPDGDGSLLTTGSDHLDAIAAHIAGLPFAFEVLDPPELRQVVRKLGLRLARMHR
jgi:predicted DNA-binding transcriptional regulator YafY